MLDNELVVFIEKSVGHPNIASIEQIQELWSGYGEILRIYLNDSTSVICKHIQWPNEINHPRGWSTNFSHKRKVKSYEVEINFYQSHTQNNLCQTPQYIASKQSNDTVFFLLEDLNTRGFTHRPTALTEPEIKSCVSWLANFHAQYLEQEPTSLWSTGTYWNLETRPDELEALTNKELKKAASKFDLALKNVPQTIVHGDAKLANFCFDKNRSSVAAVDFQYVGGGCGMKDLTYFMSSCLDSDECENFEKEILDFYFSELKHALQGANKSLDLEKLEASWRHVYPIAWADFYRFLEGWSPGHWKVNGYIQSMYKKALALAPG